MNIRELAEKDMELTLEDTVNGFAFACSITNPDKVTESFPVQSGDVHLLLENDTGIPVNNREAHVAIRISSLSAKGFEIPKAQPDESKNLWLFEFADIGGKLRKFTVLDVQPDRTLGLVVISLDLVKS